MELTLPGKKMMTSEVDTGNLLSQALKQFKKRNYSDAAKNYRHVLEHEPKNLVALEGLTRSLMRSELNQEAIVTCQRALALDDRQPVFYYLLGSIQNHIGQKAIGERYLRHALELDPSFVEALVTLGALKTDMGSLPEAESIFRQALAFDPKNQMAQIDLGITLARLGRHHEATIAIWHSFQSNPSGPTAWLFIVALHSEHFWIAPLLLFGIFSVSLLWISAYLPFITALCAGLLGAMSLGAYHVKRNAIALGYFLGAMLILGLYFTLGL